MYNRAIAATPNRIKSILFKNTSIALEAYQRAMERCDDEDETIKRERYIQLYQVICEAGIESEYRQYRIEELKVK